MPIYNCADVILTALNSIDGKVDEIWCCNGRWIGHDGPDLSPDNTEDIIKEWRKTSKSKVIIHHYQPLREWEFHNEILKAAEIGDWLFKLDSDEIITEWENVRETLENSTEKAYRICMGMFKPYATLPNAQLFKKTETLYFDLNHREIFDKDGYIPIYRAPIIHIVKTHQPETDTKKDRENMKTYEKHNAEYEQAERKNQSN